MPVTVHSRVKSVLVPTIWLQTTKPPIPSFHPGQCSPFLPPSGEAKYKEVQTSLTQELGSGPARISTKKGAALTHTALSSISAQNVIRATTASNIAGIDSFNALPLTITSPIKVNTLKHYTMSHPDRELVEFLIKGFTEGFDIMYAGPISTTTPRNLKSARDRPKAVSLAIKTEMDRGHTAGPFPDPPFAITHCSPLGAVQKDPDNPKITLILDLSQPLGESINEGILNEFCSVKYTPFDAAVDMVKSVGRSANLAKLDIQHAFRLCPVRKADWPLLCYLWMGWYFVDTRLPFGSRSSPAIFNNFADVLTWILSYIGGILYVVHYLDDFLICAPDTELCHEWMEKFVSIFIDIGVPIADDKTVGPSTKITYLGIEIDTTSQCIRLPKEKYSALLVLLKDWQDRKKCKKRELLSLVGSLSFAAKVVKPGRIFLRRLIDLSASVHKLNHHISLNSEARSDIKWWLDFLPKWNGVSFFQENLTSAKSLHLFTDASNIGMGGVFNHKWFACTWPEHFLSHDINFKEIFAIFSAISAWAKLLENKQILVHCDNLNIVTVWKTGTCKNPEIMKVIRALFFCCASHNINLLTEHIEGKINYQADFLSRMQVGKFRQENPSADFEPCQLPNSIWAI